MSFESLGLAAPLVRAVTEKGYTTPTEVQTAAIPAIISGNDLLGSSQTGTGKTAAFALPILHLLSLNPMPASAKRRPRALILAPTRELAGQIDTCFFQYGRGSNLRMAVIYGGVNQNRQTRALQRGVDIIIATPGRFLDLYQQGFIDLKAIEIVVLDEADQMLDMGFLPDVQRIMEKVPEKRQTLCFSATMPAPIRQLTQQILVDPVRIQISPEKPTAERIEQKLYMVDRSDKLGVLRQVLTENSSGSSLVFVRTKHGADKVVQRLGRSGIQAAAIHGNKSQNARQQCLQDFRQGKITVLVATDIAARGIDVTGITRVINFDCPETPETYVHRIGRTARAGRQGTAVTLCGNDERHLIKAVERHLRMKLPLADRNALPAAVDMEPMPLETSEFENRRPSRNSSRQEERSAPRRGEFGDRRAKPQRQGRSEFNRFEAKSKRPAGRFSTDNRERPMKRAENRFERTERVEFNRPADGARKRPDSRRVWKQKAATQVERLPQLNFAELERLARQEPEVREPVTKSRRNRRPRAVSR